jgi:hypothetical protein
MPPWKFTNRLAGPAWDVWACKVSNVDLAVIEGVLADCSRLSLDFLKILQEKQLRADEES